MTTLAQASAGSSPLALYAAVLAAASLDDAAQRLANALTAEFGFDRAAIGLHDAGRTRLLASSPPGLLSAPGEWPGAVLGAMDEAIDQGVSLAWPPGADAAADPILLEHVALQRLAGGAVGSVPLGLAGEAFAAVCVERHAGPPLARAELAHIEHLLALAAPALRWMQRAHQPWHRRAWRDLQGAASALRHPERRSTRRVLAGVAGAVALLALAPFEHAVSGRARIEGAEQRVLAAPADGFVKTAHVRPGDHVKAGDPLVDLLDADQRLERERWGSQLAQHENGYAAAMAKSDRVGAATSMARVVEAQSQLALVDEQLLRGRLAAPFDALVIQGDLSQSIGAPVRQGDTLLTLAASGRQRVIVEVDETDIASVQPGQAGRLALSSLPWGGDELVVERVTPMARAVEGRNVFEVEARLVAPRADVRPGLLGRAELVVGRLPPLWGWARHAAARVRVAYWAWLG